jgi:hypothetical protein
VNNAGIASYGPFASSPAEREHGLVRGLLRWPIVARAKRASRPTPHSNCRR